MDICLVNMPCAPIRVPSLALGLLQAILQRDGLGASTRYANIAFAADIGIEKYTQLSRLMSSQNVVSEWAFADVAFPGRAASPDEVVARLEARQAGFAIPDLRQWLCTLRDAAARFVEGLSDEIVADGARIVGCSSSFAQHVPSLALLRRLRAKAPDIVTMLGGANCEATMGQTTHRLFPWVDFVVSGEAEAIITPLCRDILAAGADVDVGSLPVGVLAPGHRRTGYPVVRESCDSGAVPVAVTPSLAGLPRPDYDDYVRTLGEHPAVRAAIEPGLVAEASRGCWWMTRRGCAFCGLNGSRGRYRTRPTDEVISEMSALSARYGIRRVEMVDNVLSPRLANELMPRLEAAGAPYELFFEIRTGLTRDQLRALRSAGVTWVQLGAESLDTRVLDLIDKGSKAWQNIQIVRSCTQLGIRCQWNFMYDFPGEDDGWYAGMAAFIPWLTHLQPPGALVRLRYDRFSKYHSNPERYGLSLVPAAGYQPAYGLAQHDLADLVYFFDDETRLRSDQVPLLGALLQRPGLEAARRELTAWTQAHARGRRPQLLARAEGERLRVLDTRAVARCPEVVLSGLTRDVLVASEDAPTAPNLVAAFRARGIADEDFEATLADLVDAKLLLPIDGRYIALPLRDPVPPVPAVDSFPGGALKAVDRR